MTGEEGPCMHLIAGAIFLEVTAQLRKKRDEENAGVPAYRQSVIISIIGGFIIAVQKG